MRRGVICEYCSFSFTSIANKPTTIPCSVAALSSCNGVNLVLGASLAFTNARPPPFHITNVVVLIKPDWA